MEKNLLTEEVAEMFRTSVETVAYWRQRGKGPRWYKVGRRVLYRESDVIAWASEAFDTGKPAA